MVNEDVKCWSSPGRQCWRQVYTGMPCCHALLASIERMRACDNADDKENVCKAVIKLCHKNWLRSTYSSIKVEPADIPEPVCVTKHFHVPSPSESLSLRFNEVIKFVPKDVIEKVLVRLERYALAPQDSDSDDDSDSESSLHDVVNSESSVRDDSNESSEYKNPSRDRSHKRRRLDSE